MPLEVDPFQELIGMLSAEHDRVWTSRELLNIYNEKGGIETNSSRLMNKIVASMKGELNCFSSPGLSSILIHKNNSSAIFKDINQQNDSESNVNDNIGDDDISLQTVARKIKFEINNMPSVTENYPVLDKENILSSCSMTITKLLQYVSSNFESNMKTVALISSMIRTVSNYKVSMLQVALGLLCNSSKLIEHFHDYGVTCSYNEIRQFRASAAVKGHNKTLDSSHGLIQGISDNFRARMGFSKLTQWQP